MENKFKIKHTARTKDGIVSIVDKRWSPTLIDKSWAPGATPFSSDESPK